MGFQDVTSKLQAVLVTLRGLIQSFNASSYCPVADTRSLQFIQDKVSLLMLFNNKFLTFTSFKVRTLVQNKKLRAMLRDFALKPLDTGSLTTMRTMMEEHAPVVANFISWCNHTYESWYYLPKPIRDMVQCFSTTSPVCSYFPFLHDFFSHIDTLIRAETEIGEQTNALMYIQMMAPIIFNALSTIKGQKLPEVWGALFMHLQEISSATFKQNMHDLPPMTVEKSLAFFPEWPLLCKRGTYSADRSKESTDHCNKKIEDEKKKKRHSLLPGLFTVYCQHGKCKK